MYPEERILIDKELNKKKLEHLKCEHLYLRSYSTIIEILNLPCWHNPKFQGLLTSSIWNSNAQEIQTILSLKEWKDPKFQGLLTSSIWKSGVKEIQTKLLLSYWEVEKYNKLLTPSIFTISNKRIVDAIEVAENFSIEEWITTSFLRKSKIQLLALIHYLQDNQIPLIINEKLHPVFSVAPSVLKKKYHINLKLLVEQEKIREVKLC